MLRDRDYDDEDDDKHGSNVNEEEDLEAKPRSYHSPSSSPSRTYRQHQPVSASSPDASGGSLSNRDSIDDSASNGKIRYRAFHLPGLPSCWCCSTRVCAAFLVFLFFLFISLYSVIFPLLNNYADE